MDKIPSIKTPLVIRKKNEEHAKFVIKEALSKIGVNIHAWREGRESYKKNRGAPGLLWEGQKKLSAEDVEKLASNSYEALQGYVDELTDVSDEKIKNTVQGAILEVAEYLINHKQVSKIVDVGCFYSMIGGYLTQKFNNVDCTGVDFPKNLVEANSNILSDRHKVISAYPLQYIEELQTPIDAVLFNRVFCVISYAEVIGYLQALKSKTRYIVFNEAVKTVYHFGNLNIDSIDIQNGFPMPGWTIYNYRKIFEQEGYSLIHYDYIENGEAFSTPMHYTIRGIAVPN